MSNENDDLVRPEYLTMQVNEYVLDIKLLPKFLGASIPERIQKWLEYRKLGILLIDTTNE
jgi:hypothetical protein